MFGKREEHRRRLTTEKTRASRWDSPQASGGKIVALYAVFASLWIAVSDKVLAFTIRDKEAVVELSMLKGWAYVGVTAVLLWLLIRHHTRKLVSHEAKLESLIQSMPDLVWLEDTEGRCVKCNQSFRQFFSISGEDVSTQIVLELLPDRFATDRKKAVDHVLATGENATIEEWLEPASGHRRLVVVETVLTPLVSRDGKIGGVVGISRDITTRKLIEEAVRENEAKLSTILDGVGASILIKDLDHRYSFVNRHFCEQLGLDPSEIIGKTDNDLFDDETASRIRLIDARVLQGEEVVSSSQLIPKGRDEEREFISIKLPLRRSDGTIYALSGISTDVTEQLNLKRSVQSSEERLKLALEASQMGVWEWDIATNEVFWSPECFRIAGVDSLSNSFDGFREMIHPDDVPGVISAMGDSLHHGKWFVQEFRIIRPDGRLVWLSNHALIHFDSTGEPVRMVGTAQDITARKTAEIAAREEAMRRRVMFQSSRDGLVLLNLEGCAIEANESFAALLGCTVEQVIGLYVWDWDTKMSKQSILKDMTARKSDSAMIETSFRNRNGQKLDVEVSASYIDWGGQPFVFCVCRDVTERNIAEVAIRESEEELRTVVESSPNGVIIVDESGAIVMVNRELERAFGYDREELVGQKLEILVPDGLKDQHRHDRNDYQAHPLARPMIGTQLQGHRKDGTLIPIEVGLTPIRTSRGSFVLATVQDVSARMEAEEKIRILANYDDLTGLPNRTSFHHALSAAVADAHARECRLGLLLLDVDGFKHFNDALGHHVGDRILREVSARIKGCVGANHTVARLGGDEFAVLIDDWDGRGDSLRHMARTVLDSLSRPFRLPEGEYHLTGSIGISSYPDDAFDSRVLQSCADLAMYSAKENGKNRYEFYAEVLSARSSRRLVIESSLRQAVEHKDFEVFYQPIVDLTTGSIVSAEALLRWRHPELGLLSPNEFIEVAEETNLIVPIGAWVLHDACATLGRWNRVAKKPLTMSINLSTRQFGEDGLLQLISDAIHSSGLDPSWLQLEITESAVVANPDQAVTVLNHMKELGVTIAIDDFGTGYSSLAYLKKYPIDCIKIDRSFVRDLPHDPDSAAIAKAIIAMGHSLNLRIVAEGVENPAQLRFLGDLGCQRAQGYFFSRPIPNNEFEVLLPRRWSPRTWITGRRRVAV